MPIVIGAKPESNFSDPIGLLTDCHRRIEKFLSVLVQVSTQAAGSPLSSEQRQSFENALRYFRDAAPKHTADEEDSIFPRLRQSDKPEVRDVMERMERLEHEHPRADQAHAEINRLGQAWLDSDSLSPSDAGRLSQLLSELSELYREHIAIEEQQVFPVAAELLPDSERQAISREMAGRRGLAK